MLVSILVLSVFIYFFIYSPMMAELENSIYLNISEISQSKYTSLENSIEGAVIGSVSLSSRSAIRDKIVEYENGNITLDELKSFTLPKYTDGSSVLDNAVLAQRMVSGQLIASYQVPGYNVSGLAGMEDYTHELYKQFILADGKLYIKIYSPIMQDGRELGVDIVLFDFTDKLKSLNDATYTVRILDPDEFEGLKSGASVLIRSDDFLLLAKDNGIYFTEAIDGHYFLVQADKKVIFSNANSLSIRIAVSWMIVFAAILLTIYFYIIRYANKTMKRMERSRDLFKDMAYTDKMTGLHSRVYLEIWKTNFRESNKKYSLIMVDVDRFKQINDRFGHPAGDEVLRRIAQTFLTSIRKEDVIVRYGGDEYLLILSNADENRLNALMGRISSKLSQIKEFAFPISVSYGISYLAPGEDFDDALKLADKNMYASKAEKNPTP
jgi:diguanylate cyclase (GGDEF)-like protein